jgi:hypothetical protein
VPDVDSKYVATPKLLLSITLINVKRLTPCLRYASWFYVLLRAFVLVCTRINAGKPGTLKQDRSDFAMRSTLQIWLKLSACEVRLRVQGVTRSISFRDTDLLHYGCGSGARAIFRVLFYARAQTSNARLTPMKPTSIVHRRMGND